MKLGPPLVIPDVEVDVVDEGGGPGDRVLSLLPLAASAGPEDAGLLLGDADEHHALAYGGGEVGSGDVLLALATLEADHRDVPILSEAVDGGHEVRGHLAEEVVAGDLLAAVLTEEPGELVGGLELGDVAVEEEAVEALVLEDDVLVE
jgi:hypothetical protein